MSQNTRPLTLVSCSGDEKPGEKGSAVADASSDKGTPEAATGFVGFAPSACWKLDRIESDVKLSRELIVKLDQERGVEGNPLLADDAIVQQEPQTGEILCRGAVHSKTNTLEASVSVWPWSCASL